MGGKVRTLGTMGAIALLATAGAMTAPNVTWATGDGNLGQCGARTEASPGFRTYLADCRAFELVTPPYKEGGNLVVPQSAVSEDGSHVISGVAGAFAGAGQYTQDLNKDRNDVFYEFTRGAAGWQPTVLTPPADEYPHSSFLAVSAEDFGTTLWGAQRKNRADLELGLIYHEDIYQRTGGDPSEFHFVGPGTPRNQDDEEAFAGELLYPTEELELVGASRNLGHLLFGVQASPTEVEREVHHGVSDLWPGDTTEPGAPSLYEYAYTGVPDAEPTLVGVRNNGMPPWKLEAKHVNEGADLVSNCGTELGSGSGGSAYNAVSNNGEIVFFTALHADPYSGEECASPSVNELYARIGSAKTVDISEPSKQDCGACNTTAPGNATFEGASQEGTKVFFRTEQELLPGQTGRNLYEYDFGGPEANAEHPDGKISLVSAGSTEPLVQGVVRVSENGERVYFVAEGKLTGSDRVVGREPEEEGPEEGAENLYMYGPEPAHPGSYRTVYVAKLLTHAEETTLIGEEGAEREEIEKLGEEEGQVAREEALRRGLGPGEPGRIGKREEEKVIDALRGTLGPSGTLAEDKSVWSVADARQAQATPPSGEFLVFVSSGHLTGGDASKVPQLFEYNAGDGSLTRVSIGQQGFSSGNVETFNDAVHIPSQVFNGADLPSTASSARAVSGSGSRVFFTSAARLAPGAEANTTNVYEYDAGDVYLVSGGEDPSSFNDESDVNLFGIDLSGKDAFFTTSSQLVPQDGETSMALYDAREEGGFPAPAPEPGCLGETCRGASSTTPQPQLPGSADQEGGGNLAPSIFLPETKPKLVAKGKRRCKKDFVRAKGKCLRKANPRRANAKRAAGQKRRTSQ